MIGDGYEVQWAASQPDGVATGVPDRFSARKPIGVIRRAAQVENIGVVGEIGVDMQVAIVGVAISTIAGQTRRRCCRLGFGRCGRGGLRRGLRLCHRLRADRGPGDQYTDCHGWNHIAQGCQLRFICHLESPSSFPMPRLSARTRSGMTRHVPSPWAGVEDCVAFHCAARPRSTTGRRGFRAHGHSKRLAVWD